MVTLPSLGQTYTQTNTTWKKKLRTKWKWKIETPSEKNLKLEFTLVVLLFASISKWPCWWRQWPLWWSLSLFGLPLLDPLLSRGSQRVAQTDLPKKWKWKKWKWKSKSEKVKVEKIYGLIMITLNTCLCGIYKLSNITFVNLEWVLMILLVVNLKK